MSADVSVLPVLAQRLAWLLGQRDAGYETLDKYAQRMVVVESDLDYTQKVVDLLQLTAEATRANSVSTITNIVNGALKSIFHDRNYEFVVELNTKRGASAASFFIKEGTSQFSLTDRGGGLIDVVSISLRIAYLVLHRSKQRRLLVLDESLKHLSKEYVPQAAAFLKQISKELDLKILMVTHNSTFANYADRVYQTKQLNGVASVDELKS